MNKDLRIIWGIFWPRTITITNFELWWNPYKSRLIIGDGGGLAIRWEKRMTLEWTPKAVVQLETARDLRLFKNSDAKA